MFVTFVESTRSTFVASVESTHVFLYDTYVICIKTFPLNHSIY
jgi:hypothetical protein